MKPVSSRSGCGWSTRSERPRWGSRCGCRTPGRSGGGRVGDVDCSALDAVELRTWLEGVEELRRSVDTIAVAAAGSVDCRNPFRGQGFFTAKTVIKHMCRLSGPEADRRVQTARLHEALPEWAIAEADGAVGVAQCELMARIAANPRIESAVLERDSLALLDDAIEQSFDEFERRARTWEALADPAGDLAKNDRQHANRDVMLRPRPDGGWTLTGNLPELAGVELMEIFSHFVEAEWAADWAEARHRLGDHATTADLHRTEAQRRADALLAMARAAASTPPGSQQPRPTVNILTDQESFEAHLRGETPDPRRYRDVVIRTQSGRRLHPDDAINAALIGHIRRVVVYDGSGTIIDLGRRSRTFAGLHATPSCCCSPPASGSAATDPLRGVMPITRSAGKPTAPPCPEMAADSAKATTTSKNVASTYSATTPAPGT